MDHHRIVQVVGLPAQLARPAAEVNVLHVHEIGAVEEPCLGEYIPPNHEAGAGDQLGRYWLTRLTCDYVEAPPVREHSSAEGRIQELVQDARNTAHAVPLRGEVGRDQPGANDGSIRGGSQRVQHAAQRVSHHLRVRIQEKKIAPGGEGEGKIVGGGEAQIFWQLQEVHLRETLRQHLSTTIAGAVVHHQHLEIQGSAVAEDAAQTAMQILRRIPVDDDDGELGRRHSVVPTGLVLGFTEYPGLPSWALLSRPCGAGFG
jgi:hypothetical protein